MPLGPRLFSFGVVADTHVNQEEDRASSDFAVNRLANARNRHAFRALAARKPAFVVHLGDIVHPTPGHPGYAAAAAAYAELAGAFDCPVLLTPGNHDVGDKPGDWLPVPSVNEAYLAAYRQHFGPNYHAYDHEGCHVVVIDAQLVNSGLADEAVQRRWLEADLAAHRGERIFLALHYPPYLLHPGEPGHYDNLDEPGRSWLLALLAAYGVEAVFAGHVHNFWYHRHGSTDLYLLPSTAFVRLDYSEMYRVEPGPERGRDDAPKLGYLVVDVHERGHVAHPIRTFGRGSPPGETAGRRSFLPPVHTRTIVGPLPGIDLRHPWAEVTEMAASGALDEFSRKAVRNDWPLLALWEMGVRRLRVPLSDLADAATRRRMGELRRLGHEFTAYTHGVPSEEGRALLRGHDGLLAAWEVIAPLAGLDAATGPIAQLRREACVAVRLSRLVRPGDALHHGDRARHVIEHGFLTAEADRLAPALSAIAGFREAFDAIVFRVPRALAPAQALRQVASAAAALDLLAEAYVRLADDNPARAQDDERDNANRVAETLFAAHAFPHVGTWLDTLDDVDRGYFPRRGLVDRRFNPRLAGLVFRHLAAALAPMRAAGSKLTERMLGGGRILALEADAGSVRLVLPEPACRVVAPEGAGGFETIDLATGEVRAFEPFACEAPALLRSYR